MTRFFARYLYHAIFPGLKTLGYFQGARPPNRYRDNSTSIIALTPAARGPHCPRNLKQNLIMKYLLVLTLALAMPIFSHPAEAASSADDKAAITKLEQDW